MKRFFRLPIFVLLVWPVASVSGDEASDVTTDAVGVPEPELAARGLQLPDGLSAAVFDAEPLVVNPVSFSLDHQGRARSESTYCRPTAGGVSSAATTLNCSKSRLNRRFRQT